MFPTSLQGSFRKFLGKDADGFSGAEEGAINQLVRFHQRLVMEGGRVNTKSEVGFNACQVFLQGLDTAAKALKVESASRGYRVHFTINYRALFPDEARNYRVDVLEASVEQYAVIWVNGDKFEFSAEAMRRAESLQRSWADLCSLLERWHQALDTRSIRPIRSEMRAALLALDSSWASFEHKYIAELIEIEEKARRLVVQAIDHERSLQLLEAQYKSGSNPFQVADELQALPEYQDEMNKLVACIAHLNSVANFRRKGRDDLLASVLFDAVRTLRRCEAGEAKGESTDLFTAARILARDVVESFHSMREYLREVGRCLERVDPHLCNNVGLVARLVDWEESWEVGTRYVQHEGLLSAICAIVAEVRSAQRSAPALAQMCEDCDVELFLVLPRIIWLRYLATPDEVVELVRSILPHRFNPKVADKDASGVSAYSPDEEVQAFLSKYNSLLIKLTAALPNSVDKRKAACEILVKRVVNGAGSEGAYSSIESSKQTELTSDIEDLIHELEKWSIELQRHCPEDWNQASAILVQCLTGGNEKQRPVPFRV
mmetsp:Transcript_75303/g.156870  ORF Transcript_75303/g.156870 Transcript_75303/m.156870 type:complete len:546 (-) Transcript_75303:202-1839(-)